MAEKNANAEEKNEIKNNVTVEQVGPCKKKVVIEIAAEKIAETTDKQYETLSKDALIPGFRKGRAPRRLLEKRFGKEVAEQVKVNLLLEASESAIKDNELDVLGEPDIDHTKIELPEKGPLKFNFEVEVRPEFELPKLSDIPVKKTKQEVTDEQVGREIEHLRKSAGMWAPKEEGQPAQPGDQIIANAELKVEDAEEEERFDNIDIFVRKNGFVGAVPVENLDELLDGTKTGDVKNTTVEVPKTFFREEYRGKKVDVKIEVKDIKWLKPADLDEAFFQRVDVENEQDLREKVQDMLENRLESEARAEMSEQIHKYLLENTDFDLPLDVVADQAQTILQRQYVNLLQRGLDREQLESEMEQLRAGSEEQAKGQLKSFFIMDKVADELDIEVSDEEINGRIARVAIMQSQRPEQLKEQMTRNGSLGQFRLQVREEKCIEKLLESADIGEIETPEKEKKDKAAKKTQKKPGKKSEKKTEKKSGKSEKKAEKKTGEKAAKKSSKKNTGKKKNGQTE